MFETTGDFRVSVRFAEMDVCMHMLIYIYIYAFRQEERKREVRIWIYIYIHILYVYTGPFKAIPAPLGASRLQGSLHIFSTLLVC